MTLKSSSIGVRARGPACWPDRPRAGFTLIEMLVVIAIIGLLAAILFPVFSRVRENGRRAACMSNLKQIWLGAMQYVQDCDDMLPAITYGDTAKPTTHYYRWMDVIEPYVGNTQVFSCPSDHINPGYVYATKLTNTSTTTNGSYGLNNTYNNSKTQPASQWNVSASGGTYDKKYGAIAAPSTTIYCLEKTDSKVWYVQWKDQPNQPSFANVTDDPEDFISTEAFADSYINEGISLRHFQSTNALFCDGHVKAVRADYLLEKSSGGAFRYFTTADD